MTGKDWTKEEVLLIVNDYFTMLQEELCGRHYNKAQHRRFLQVRLLNRSEPAIERKHQNISSILMGLGLPFINGYKPLSNSQRLLTEEIGYFLKNNPHFFAIFQNYVDDTVCHDKPSNIQPRFVKKPQSNSTIASSDISNSINPKGIDYLHREAQNIALGEQGEHFVIKFEKQRLIGEGKEQLAEKIEHVSVTQGPYMGFDVLSFNSDGEERYIEVKTTKFGISTPFFITPHEVETSEKLSKQYHLYRVFNFHRRPKIYRLAGCMRDNCHLTASSYKATPV